MKKIKNKMVVIIAVFVLIGIAAGFGGYVLFQHEYAKKNPDATAKAEVTSIVGKIGRHMELPNDEQATLATVVDKSKLANQDFFKKAVNGDKILIYTKARKAILYRPSTDRVIEFAPLLIGDGATPNGQAQSKPSPSSKTKPVSVAIYNGTATSGYASEVGKKMSELGDISIKSKVNAAKSDYTESLVFDVSGSHDQLAKDIASDIGGKVVSSLPEGETQPSADILVVAGK
jgi:hypothetical protein